MNFRLHHAARRDKDFPNKAITTKYTVDTEFCWLLYYILYKPTSHVNYPYIIMGLPVIKQGGL